jgi:hypothetical protein
MRDEYDKPSLSGTRSDLAQAIFSSVDRWKHGFTGGPIIGWWF